MILEGLQKLHFRNADIRLYEPFNRFCLDAEAISIWMRKPQYEFFDNVRKQKEIEGGYCLQHLTNLH